MIRVLVCVAFALLVMPGCLGQHVEAPVPPQNYTGAGPPAMPEHPADADNRGCVADAAFAWPQGQTTFQLPVTAAFADAHADAWRAANVTVLVESTHTETLRAKTEASTGNLSFTLEQSQSDFASRLTPGVYVAWNLTMRIESRDSALAQLQPLGKPALHGWLLVTRGSDDKLWVYLEGQRLPEDPFPAARLLGGVLFVSSHGICV